MIVIDEKIIEYLVETNKHKYNLHKASEEFQELALVLNQKLLKPNKVDDKEIIDEIGDAIIRMEVLKRMFNIDDIQKRIDNKLSKYKEYKDHELYNGHI